MSSKNPGRSEVKSRKSPDLQDRLEDAAKAKQAMVERFRAKSDAGAAGDKDAAGAGAAKKPAAKKEK